MWLLHKHPLPMEQYAEACFGIKSGKRISGVTGQPFKSFRAEQHLVKSNSQQFVPAYGDPDCENQTVLGTNM
jgi:hypothetical protein